MTTTYWHVTGPDYRDGDDLVCWERLVEDGYVDEAAWKWPDAPVGWNGHLICLFPDTDEGRRERDEWAAETAGAKVLRIDVDTEDECLVEEDLEGYPAIAQRIPALYITRCPA